jgi:hypothetical protein
VAGREHLGEARRQADGADGGQRGESGVTAIGLERAEHGDDRNRDAAARDDEEPGARRQLPECRGSRVAHALFIGAAGAILDRRR